jgi:hypothetical protein
MLCREANVTPLTSDAAVREHMSRVTALAFDRPENRDAPEQLAGEVDAGTAMFTFPALGNTTITDIQQLRANEELFHDIRTSLNELAHIVGELPHIPNGDYLTYAHEVRTAADDVVRPTYEKVRRQQKVAKRRSLLVSLSGGGLVGLAVQGLALLAPPTAHAGPMVSNAARQLISRRSQRKLQQLKVASSLLLSVLPTDEATTR